MSAQQPPTEAPEAQDFSIMEADAQTEADTRMTEDNEREDLCGICDDPGSGKGAVFQEWLKGIHAEEEFGKPPPRHDENADLNPRVKARHRYAVEVFLGEEGREQDPEQVHATLDTGAWIPWISEKLYSRHAREPPRETRGTRDADGRPLHVLGEGDIFFSLWGQNF